MLGTASKKNSVSVNHCTGDNACRAAGLLLPFTATNVQHGLSTCQRLHCQYMLSLLASDHTGQSYILPALTRSLRITRTAVAGGSSIADMATYPSSAYLHRWGRHGTTRHTAHTIGGMCMDIESISPAYGPSDKYMYLSSNIIAIQTGLECVSHPGGGTGRHIDKAVLPEPTRAVL
jgi:hypothetical protein